MLAKPVIPKVYTPHVYQQKAASFVLNSFEHFNCAALFLDMGLGKTSTTLNVFKTLKEQGKVKRMLIVAPLRVAQTTWSGEIKKWLDFMDFSYVILHGSDKSVLLQRDADVYIINYEGLVWLTEQNWRGADMLVFDELTRMKNWSSKRVKAIKPFLPTFKYRLGLTGTPMPNGLADLFSQIYMLDLGASLGAKLSHFQTRYFKPKTQYSFKLQPYPGSLDKVTDKLRSIAFRMDANDWIDLPQEIYNNIELHLTPALKKQYDFLKEEFLVALGETIITAQSASVLSTKLRQFLSGNIYTEDGDVQHVHDIKMMALREFVDDLNGSPVLVGYQYRHEIPVFKKLFPEATFIESSTTGPKLQQIVADWNNGDIAVLFGHPSSIGHGLNLQESSNTVLFYSLDFNLENYLQFIKRVCRQGQKQKHVIIHYLVFKNTIDEHIQAILSGKDSLQNVLLDFLKV